MKSVSQQFKDMIITPGKQQSLTIESDDKVINAESVSLTIDGALFSSLMRICSIESPDSGIITGQRINVRWGLKVAGKFEYLDYGYFVINEATDDRDTNMYKLVGYDKMINFMIDCDNVPTEYPCTLREYLQSICDVCHVELSTDSFFNEDLQIPYDYFEGLGVTYRDVLDQIAEVTCSTIFIKDNKLYLSDLNPTEEILSPDILKTVTIKEEFKPLTSFVLARSPQNGDDVYRPEEEPEDLSELAFTNNQFLDKRRDEVIDGMFEHLEGLNFWTFECDELGAGYFDPCDLVTIEDREGNLFENCLIINNDLRITDGASELLSSVLPQQTTTRYKYATTQQKDQKRSEIIVKKLENQINYLTEEQTGLGYKLVQLIQNLSGFEFDVRATSGINVFLNSVGLNNTEFWTVERDSVAGVQSEYIINNTTSKSAFRINGGKISQSFSTIIGHGYALTFKYRQRAGVTGSIKWIDNSQLELLEAPVSGDVFIEVSRVFIAQSNKVSLSIESDGDYLEVTDLVCKHIVLRPGDIIEDVSVPWSPNPNEIYGSNVFIDLNGVTIYELTSFLKNVLNSRGMAIVNTLNGNILLEVTHDRTYIDYLQAGKIKVGSAILETTTDGWHVESIGGDH